MLFVWLLGAKPMRVMALKLSPMPARLFIIPTARAWVAFSRCSAWVTWEVGPS